MLQKRERIMKAIKLFSSASLLIGAALTLAACGQNDKNAVKSAKKFPEQTAQKTALGLNDIFTTISSTLLFCLNL